MSKIKEFLIQLYHEILGAFEDYPILTMIGKICIIMLINAIMLKNLDNSNLIFQIKSFLNAILFITFSIVYYLIFDNKI